MISHDVVRDVVDCVGFICGVAMSAWVLRANGQVGVVSFILVLVLECYCLNKLVLLVDGVGPVVLAGRFLRGGMMLGPSDFLVLRSNKVFICVDSCW